MNLSIKKRAVNNSVHGSECVVVSTGSLPIVCDCRAARNDDCT